MHYRGCLGRREYTRYGGFMVSMATVQQKGIQGMGQPEIVDSGG